MARPLLVYVTSRFPFGSGEAFLVPEIQELRRTFDLLIVPMHPDADVLHADAKQLLPITAMFSLASLTVLISALAELLKSPLRAFHVFRVIASESRCLRILLRNLAVFPKGLWLSREMRHRKARHLHAHWASSSATLGFVASEVSGIPWSLTAHRWDIPEDNLLRAKAQSALFMRAICERGAESLRKLSGASADRVVVIHLGVELPSKLAPLKMENSLRVLVAANLVEVKGHRYLLDAISVLRASRADVHLDVAGAGPLRTALEAQVVALGIRSSVEFLGVVSHESLLRDLQAGRWNAVVLPSVVTQTGNEEGIPVALMEAMACGIAVVATQTGGIPELVAPGTGIVVPERSSSALASALQRLHDDPELRLELGERASERVRVAFAASITGPALGALITVQLRNSR